MGAEAFLEDYKREVDRYVDEELGGGYASGSKRTLSLLKAGVVILALTLLVPLVIAFFVRGGLFWDNSIVAVIVLSAVLAAGGVVAFSANKKSAERYSVEKRAKRLKQIAHDLVVSDAYKDLKRDEAARAARTKASSLDASQKVISLIWKFCYFLVVADFINWAKIWCMKGRLPYLQYLLQNDVHGPVVLRANMTPRNFPEWYETFGANEKDAMYLPEDKRISIW